MRYGKHRILGAAAVALMALGLGLAGCGSRGVLPGSPPGTATSSSMDDTRVPAAGAIPGRYIVVLHEGTLPQEVARGHGVKPDTIYRAALHGFAGPASAAQAKALRGDRRVQSVEPDRVVSLVEPMGKPSGGTGAITEPLPTGVNRIDAEQNARSAADGGIAIIDTGIAAHTLLNVAGGATFVAGTKSYKDDNGHGTHVAGTAAARKTSSGFQGVAAGAPLYAVKVLDRNGSGWLSWVIAGVDWVTANARARNIRVANMSLGFLGSSPALDAAIHRSVTGTEQNGYTPVTYVVAAGNSSADASAFSPANHPDVVCVSAIADSDGAAGGQGAGTPYGADDTFAAFSNYGATVDVAAPGVNIRSTYLRGGFATMSGTSMASPHVAGAAALYIAGHPGAAPADVRAALIAAGKPQILTFAEGGLGFLFGSDPDTSLSSHEPLVYAKDL